MATPAEQRRAVTIGNRSFYIDTDASSIDLEIDGRDKLNQLINTVYANTSYNSTRIIQLFTTYLPYGGTKLNHMSAADKRDLVSILSLYLTHLQNSRSANRNSIRDSGYQKNIKPVEELIASLTASSSKKTDTLRKRLDKLTEEEILHLLTRLAWFLARKDRIYQDNVESWSDMMDAMDALHLSDVITSLQGTQGSLPTLQQAKDAATVEELGTAMQAPSSSDDAAKQLEELMKFLTLKKKYTVVSSRPAIPQLDKQMPSALIRGGAQPSLIQLVTPMFDAVFGVYGPDIAKFLRERNTIPEPFPLVPLMQLSHVMNQVWSRSSDTSALYQINKAEKVIPFLTSQIGALDAFLTAVEEEKKEETKKSFLTMEHVYHAEYQERIKKPFVYLFVNGVNATINGPTNGVYLLYTNDEPLRDEYIPPISTIDLSSVDVTENTTIPEPKKKKKDAVKITINKPDGIINHMLFQLLLLRHVQLSYPEIPMEDIETILPPPL